MKLDTTALRYLSNEDWRVLTAVEIGSKNHEVIPTPLIVQLSHLRSGSGVHKSISTLAKANLIARTKNAKYDGYRLTYGGLDYLALHTHLKSGTLYSTGNCIGAGKESDIYVCAPPPTPPPPSSTQTPKQRHSERNHQVVLKIHRLGRISFRSIKHNRDYLGRNRTAASWMYMSRLAAQKEFTFMKTLHENGFPVPRAIAQSRHTVVMELVGDGMPLRSVRRLGRGGGMISENEKKSDGKQEEKAAVAAEEELLEDEEEDKGNDPAAVGALYAALLAIIVDLAHHGLIHGDFNEFNILIQQQEPSTNTQPPPPKITIIDFPQMLSTSHPNADFYFDRDVRCIKTFFRRRFGFTSEQPGPFLADVKKAERIGAAVVAGAGAGDGRRPPYGPGINGVKKRLDVEVEASGFSKKMAKELEKYMKEVGVDGDDDGDDIQSEREGDRSDDEFGVVDSEGDENEDEHRLNDSLPEDKQDEIPKDSGQDMNALSTQNG